MFMKQKHVFVTWWRNYIFSFFFVSFHTLTSKSRHAMTHNDLFFICGMCHTYEYGFKVYKTRFSSYSFTWGILWKGGMLYIALARKRHIKLLNISFLKAKSSDVHVHVLIKISINHNFYSFPFLPPFNFIPPHADTTLI